MPSARERLDRARLDNQDTAAAWDAYCRRHPAATPYHLSAWSRAVAEALQHEPYCLCALDSGAITGVLPLFLRRSRLFGTNLVSVPAANVGGPLADDDATACRLVEGAIGLARELNVNFLEVRDVAPASPVAGLLQLDHERYVTVAVDLDGGETAVWSRFRKRVRRALRDSQNAGFSFELGDDINAFYPVYAASMKRLGSPPFGRQFFAALRAGFGAELRVGIARAGSVVSAVDLLITLNGVGYSVFAGSRAGHWHLNPNQFLLWAELKEACAQGLRSFDLGRSLAGSGALEFKLGWGGRAMPLVYGYALQRARRIPARTPGMPLYRALGRVWSLLPDRVVTALGPRLVRHLF